jgi:hypothetical protein
MVAGNQAAARSIAATQRIDQENDQGERQRPREPLRESPLSTRKFDD